MGHGVPAEGSFCQVDRFEPQLELVSWINRLFVTESLASPVPTFSRWTEEPGLSGKTVHTFVRDPCRRLGPRRRSPEPRRARPARQQRLPPALRDPEQLGQAES
jgi:hypothetical protein